MIVNLSINPGIISVLQPERTRFGKETYSQTITSISINNGIKNRFVNFDFIS